MLACYVEHDETLGPAECLAPEPYNLPEMRAAIAALFFELPQRLDTRYLWTYGRVSYFRVNWWSAAATGADARRIVRSAFVRAEELPDGWRIHELPERAAA